MNSCRPVKGHIGPGELRFLSGGGAIIASYTEISRRCDFLLFRVRRAMSIVGTNDDFVWLQCGILIKLDLLVMEGWVFLLLDHL